MEFYRSISYWESYASDLHWISVLDPYRRFSHATETLDWLRGRIWDVPVLLKVLHEMDISMELPPTSIEGVLSHRIEEDVDLESTTTTSSVSIPDLELERSDRLKAVNSLRIRFFTWRRVWRLDSSISRDTPSYPLKEQAMCRMGVVREVGGETNSESDIEECRKTVWSKPYHFGSTTLPHFPFTAASRRCRVSCVSFHSPTTYCQYGFLLPHGFCKRALHLRNHLFLLSTPHSLSPLLLHLFTQLCHVLIQIVLHFLVACHLIICRSELTSCLLQFSRTRFQLSFHFFNSFL